jgi:hypothetical protein
VSLIHGGGKWIWGKLEICELWWLTGGNTCCGGA